MKQNLTTGPWDFIVHAMSFISVHTFSKLSSNSGVRWTGPISDQLHTLFYSLLITPIDKEYA